MEDSEIVERIVGLLGGVENVSSAINCMTRLRVTVKNEALVNATDLRRDPKIIGVLHDRALYFELVVGPGRAAAYAAVCRQMGIPAADSAAGSRPKASDTAPLTPTPGRGRVALRSALKAVGEIFVPLIPGIIVAGLCSGFASLLAQVVPNYRDIRHWYLIWQMLSLISTSFMSFITAWAGYRAAERFGATPILGGMLGMITSLSAINDISKLLGLYNMDAPLTSVLMSGKGGVLATIVGVFVLSAVEKRVRSRVMPSLSIVFTPLITLLVCAVPYVLVIMPVFGWVSHGAAWVLAQACSSDNLLLRMVVGYAAAAVFLPLVACGMHHGLVALYATQLQELGRVVLYPALSMAGAGQVGASIALYFKAKRLGHRRLRSVIAGSLPAGFLGVGEPLVYGVTLPMGRPFVTAGLGAGFGGAFVMAARVASTAWGPSGLLGVFVMTAGDGGAFQSVGMYLVGLAISYVMGFVITWFAIGDDAVLRALGGAEVE